MTDVGEQLKAWMMMLDNAGRQIAKKATPSGYYSPAGIVLDRGCEMKMGRGKPPHVGSMGQCYVNAQRLAIFDPRKYRYAEGWAVLGDTPLPVLHAWCVNRRGYVVDPTWYGRDKAYYYGVVIDIDYVLKRQLATGMFHAMIDDWEHGSQLLRTPGLAKKVTKKCRRRRRG
jgi:hypothetical protein